MLRLAGILSYGRDFGEGAGDQWWYSRADEQIVHVDRLRQEYGFRSDDELYGCDFLVPVWHTDILREERAFLRVQPRSPLVRSVEAAPDDQLDRLFRIYIEQARQTFSWHEWQQKALLRDGVKWCRDHAIPYI